MFAVDTIQMLEMTSPGGRRLHCILQPPCDVAWARVLIVHGYGEHAGRYAQFMQFLAGAGVASEAVDLRGHGRSPGRRGFVLRWEEYLEDLRAFMRREDRCDPNLPTFVLGHSHGGLIIAAAVERGILTQDRVAGCILCSPYLATLQPIPLYKLAMARVADRVAPWLAVPTGLRGEWRSGDPVMRKADREDPYMSRTATPRWFISMRKAQAKTLQEAEAFKLPLLCLIGENDVIADPAAVAAFYSSAAAPDKSLYTYAGGVHELLRDFTREKASADILGWMRARVKG